MSPLVRACTLAAVLAGLTTAVDRTLPPVQLESRGDPSLIASAGALMRPCPPKTLLDNQVCVPAPTLQPSSDSARSPVQNWQIHDRLPRRPDRPRDYTAYRSPVAADRVAPSPWLLESQIPGDALLLTAPLGASVTLQPLEAQRGPSFVLYVGELVGRSVVTEHHVADEAGRSQSYLVIYGNLASTLTRAGVQLDPGAKLGSVGSSASAHVVGLHLEVRRVRHGVDARELRPEQFRQRSETVAIDARNVFPLKAPPSPG